MKKEYFWFLIFILAAAVITGSTLGMITNFKYISQQCKLRLNEQETQEKISVSQKTNTQAAPSSNTQTNNSARDNQSASESTATITVGTSDENVKLPISQDERQEIEAMLKTVNSGNSPDYNAKVKNFQKDNSLPTTGTIDTQTLQVLINQATLQKAIQRLDN